MEQITVYFDTKLFDLPIPRSRPIANQAIDPHNKAIAIKLTLHTMKNPKRLGTIKK
ncbi:hypothetical protein [Spirulina sp. 06S082]|uniref:hypothetical protein n=1 Tax=Spirulina sp. 06S082 TaxID=3110248 RepID=UPI002B216644|nr:hypothetical protein [Spirulina sp. 06S082]MEA5471401.1 hypothetical protein [Spirulina sp. 06S082]